MQFLQANTQIKVRIGPFVDVGDGFTPETGITLSAADEAELLKNDGAATVDISGATWAAVTGCDGWYDLTLTASHTDTEGLLTVVVQDDSVCLPVYCHFMVIAQAAYTSLITAKDTGYMDVDVKALGGTTQSATDLKDFADAGYDPATNKVQGVVLVDTCTTNTDMRGTDNALLAASAPANFGDLSITASTGRVDVGAWLGTAVTLSSTTALPEVDAKSISDDATAADNIEDVYDDTTYTVANLKTFWNNANSLTGKTVDQVGSTAIRTGTAQAGAATSITLDASASATDNLYLDTVIIITGGTGAGQVNSITAYDGSTKVATVLKTWEVTPDATSTFELQPATSMIRYIMAMASGKLAFSGNVVSVYDQDGTTLLYTNTWSSTGRTRS